MSGRVLARIDDMLSAIDAIEYMITGRTADQVMAEPITMLAMERAFEIVSEASRHIPDDLKASKPDIAWRQIAGIGNILRHDYQSIRGSIITGVAYRDIPPLKEALLDLTLMLEK